MWFFNSQVDLNHKRMPDPRSNSLFLSTLWLLLMLCKIAATCISVGSTSNTETISNFKRGRNSMQASRSQQTTVKPGGVTVVNSDSADAGRLRDLKCHSFSTVSLRPRKGEGGFCSLPFSFHYSDEGFSSVQSKLYMQPRRQTLSEIPGTLTPDGRKRRMAAKVLSTRTCYAMGPVGR